MESKKYDKLVNMIKEAVADSQIRRTNWRYSGYQ